MIEQPLPTPPKRTFRWPWFVLLGVVLFFTASVLWMMVFVQRVKRIKQSTIEMTNSAPAKR